MPDRSRPTKTVRAEPVEAPVAQAQPSAAPKANGPSPLNVEIWFDLICPWCWIGKRQLELALLQFSAMQPDRPVAVHWRPQQLLPDVPPQGLPFREFYLDRLGSAAAVASRQAQVREAGSQVGLAFDFSAIAVMPNTEAAHALIADAQAQCDEATVSALIQEMFEAHFTRGLNLDDRELLDLLAERHGIEHGVTAPRLEPMASGVPLFVINQGLALSGAQSVDRVLELLVTASVLGS